MKKEENSLNTWLKHLPAAYACYEVITDGQGHPVEYRVLDANSAFETMTGLALEKTAGQESSAFFSSMFCSPCEWSHYYEQAATGGGRQRFNLRDETSDRWYEVIVYSDRPGFLVAIFWEVTQCMKQQMEQLKTSEQILKETQRIALIGRWDLNHSTSKLHWSDTIFKMFEVDPKVFGATYEGFLQAIHPEDREKVNQAFQASLVNKMPYEITHRLLLSDGRIKWVYEKCESWFDEKGVPLVSVGIVQDISALKEIEESLREQQRYLRTILETSKDGFWVVDRKGNITDVNQAYCHMSGFTVKELLNMNIGDLDMVETPEMTRDRIQKIYEVGSEIFETRHRKKDGSHMDVEVSVSCSDASTGEMVCFCRDITSRKQQEKSLRNAMEQAESANNAKSRYLAHMNHEIRTPLNGFVGFLQLMETTHLDHQQQEYLLHMKQSTNHMLSIINNVLDMAKIEAGEMKLANRIFDLEEEIKTALAPLRSLAKQKNIHLKLTVTGDLPRCVEGDPDRFRQILLNLGGNAVKFTQEGQVHIDVQCLESTEKQHKLQLVVEDTGPGMTRETLDKMFLPFYQVDDGATPQSKGTGLGMTITQELVELMDGHIQADSTLGKGTRVKVNLMLKAISGRCNERQPYEDKSGPEGSVFRKENDYENPSNSSK